jgi:hypothetical protein
LAIRATLLLFCLPLAACGTYVPPLQEYVEGPEAGGQLVHAILQNVTCELKNAVYDVLEQDRRDFREGIIASRNTAWLETWGAQLVLNITIDEKGTVNPKINGLPPSPASAIFNIAGEATGSSASTRIDKLHSFYTIKELAATRCLPERRPGGLFLMQSDLKFKEWLEINVVEQNTGFGRFPGDSEGPFKQDVISHEVKFVIDTSGSLTPGWKLTRVAVNQSGSFLTASRTRTQDVTITLGPLDKNELKAGRVAPSVAARNSILASEIGLSVANALRSSGPVPFSTPF